MIRKILKQSPYLLAGALALDPQLIDLGTGKTSQLSKELEEQGIAVFVSKDCSPCRQYFKTLKTCPDKLQQKLHFVSVDAAKKSKEMLAYLPEGRPLFLLKKEDDSVIIEATPTSMHLDGKGELQKKIGLLSCESLAKWSGAKL